MIDFFYTIFKKDAGTSEYVFYRTFSIFIFFLVLSVLGFINTVLYFAIITFYKFDYSYVLIFNISISIVYPISRIFYPGYKMKTKIENYSKNKIGFIFYTSLIVVFIFILMYLQIISWILFPESNFSVLHWYR
jgi:hypothetical protein